MTSSVKTMLREVQAVEGALLASQAPTALPLGSMAYAFRQVSPRVDAQFSALPHDVLEVTLAGGHRYMAAADRGAPRLVRHGSGDSVIYPAGTEISLQGRCDADVVLVTLDPKVLRGACEDMQCARLEPLQATHSISLVRAALGLLTAHEAVEAHGVGYQEAIEIEIGHVILASFSGDRAEQRTAPLAPATVRRVVDYMRDHLGEPCSLSVLAGVAGLSKFHFLRGFRAATGHSPHQKLLAIRLAEARWRLSRSHCDLGQLAYALGFSSQAHFTNLFTRATGLSPGRYRRLFRRRSFG